MENYFKGALKVFTGYCTVLIIFVVFLISVFGFANESNLRAWLAGYSFAIFLLLALILYSDMKKLATKEKRPQYDLNPYPLKGFVFGILGFLPFILLQLVYPFISGEGTVGPFPMDRVKSVSLSTLLGPMYFVIYLGGKTVIAYIVASILVPLVTMLGYLAGFYGFELRKNKNRQQSNTTNKN